MYLFDIMFMIYFLYWGVVKGIQSFIKIYWINPYKMDTLE